MQTCANFIFIHNCIYLALIDRFNLILSHSHGRFYMFPVFEIIESDAIAYFIYLISGLNFNSCIAEILQHLLDGADDVL